eukprot:scaffold101782_cov55-Phaeocystis_antarctica.AAC.2
MRCGRARVWREGEEEHEEDEAGGGDEPQLQHGVGADEEDHGGEHELAPQVDGLPVVELVLVGVGEQRDARGVLARRLPHEGKGSEDARHEDTHSSEHCHEPPVGTGAVGRRVGAQVGLAQQLDAIEGLQRLARNRRVE